MVSRSKPPAGRPGAVVRVVLASLLVVIVAGCQMAPGLASGSLRRTIAKPVDEVRAALLARLRPIYLVNEDDAALEIESNPFATPARGVFGLGAPWEQKVIFRISFAPVMQDQAQHCLVTITSRIVEHQPPNPSLQPGQPTTEADKVTRDFFLLLQTYQSEL